VPQPLQEEQPVGEVRVNQRVEVVELHEERRVADPRQRELAGFELRKLGRLVLAGAPGDERLPHHLPEERARVEGFGGRQLLE
jgi:hypothetical protein